jgi:hypothetical protein
LKFDYIELRERYNKCEGNHKSISFK